MGGYRHPIGSFEQTVKRAEQQQFNAETRDAAQAKACRCPSPNTYYDEDGDKRCLCGREARS